MGSIEEIWERIEVQFDDRGCDLLHPGATPEQLDTLEQELGLKLPPQLRESLLRHDGSDDGGWPHGELLSTERIVEEVEIWRDILDEGTFDDSSDHDPSGGEDKVKLGWWQRGWIPLDADGAGNGHVVDTDPGPKGQSGQVVFMDHENGPEGPTHGDLLAYLTEVHEGIANGTFVWKEDAYWDQA